MEKSKYFKLSLNSCIKFPGHLDAAGNAVIYSNKKGTLKASNIVLEEKIQRPIKDTCYAYHTCGSKNCINPNHIIECEKSEKYHDKKITNTTKNNAIITITKDSVCMAKYLLNRINTIYPNCTKEENENERKKICEFLSIPSELLNYIEHGVIWNYIYLTHAQKVEAYNKLENFLPKDECIEADWGNPNEYPFVHKNNRQIKASRYSYDTYNNSISTGKDILHTCDNKRCFRAAHLRTGDQKDNMNEKVQRRRTTRDKRLCNPEIINSIVCLRDEKKLSYNKIGKEIAMFLGNDKAYDHKTIQSIYENRKLASREEIDKRPPSQRELLNNNMDIIIEYKHNQNYSLRQIAIKLGNELIGKPFDLNLIGEVYKQYISDNNLVSPKNSMTLLEENKDEILRMFEENQSLRKIASTLTERLKPKKPFSHGQISKIIVKHQK